MAARSSPKLTAKHETRRAQILCCAAQEFTKHGFHGAGMSAIAKACDMSVGHVYHYFDSKEALIQAVIQAELDHQAEGLNRIEQLAPEHISGNAVQKVEEIITNSESPFRTVLNFEILAEAQRNPQIAKLLQDNDREMRRRFSAVLERAGIDDTEARTELLFAFFSGLPARALRHPEQEHQSLVELMVPIIQKILGAALRDKPSASDGAS